MSGDETQELLDRLTSWTRAGGVDPGNPDATPPGLGEASSAIDDIKAKLADLGVDYRWNPNTGSYDADSSS